MHGIRKVSRGKWHDLDGITKVVSIAGLLGSIFFSFSSFTGNAIGAISPESSTSVGVILFAIGLMGAFFFLSRK